MFDAVGDGDAADHVFEGMSWRMNFNNRHLRDEDEDRWSDEGHEHTLYQISFVASIRFDYKRRQIPVGYMCTLRAVRWWGWDRHTKILHRDDDDDEYDDDVSGGDNDDDNDVNVKYDDNYAQWLLLWQSRSDKSIDTLTYLNKYR